MAIARTQACNEARDEEIEGVVGSARAKLKSYKPLKLGQGPTALEPMNRLSRTLGGPQLFVKRDDCTGLALGGNKIRKLSYQLIEAREQGADTLVTIGGIQSNHARQTAAAAAKLGMKCHLVLQDMSADHPDEYCRSGNALIDQMLGAEITLVSGVSFLAGQEDDDAEDLCKGPTFQDHADDIMAKVRARGGMPYFVPLGASTGVGSLGYVECAFEIAEQFAAFGGAPDVVLVASGSGGTQAGLVTGFKALGLKTRTIGIGVSGASQETRRGLVHSIAQEIAAIIDIEEPITLDDIDVRPGLDSPVYGEYGAATLEALQLAGGYEGLLLDPVYSGKAMAGLVDVVRCGDLLPDQNLTFVHTGGSPGLFAYSSSLQREFTKR